MRQRSKRAAWCLPAFYCSVLVNSQRPDSNLYQANSNNSSTTCRCTTAVSGREKSVTVREDTLSSVKCDQNKHSANCSDWLADHAIRKSNCSAKVNESSRGQSEQHLRLRLFWSSFTRESVSLSHYFFTQIKSLLLFLFAWHKVDFNHLVSSSFDLIIALELSNC